MVYRRLGIRFGRTGQEINAPRAPEEREREREDELAECIDTWIDKRRRLEAHGEEFKLAPVVKINALRMLTTGKSREFFDLWESDGDKTDTAKTYEELNKIKD